MSWFLIWVAVGVASLAQCRPQAQSTSNVEKVTLLPFYGGAKGQSLQIVETPDGNVTMTIIKTPPSLPEPSEEAEIDAQELIENPPLPTKQDISAFGDNIKNIQRTAADIVKLQEIAKKNGKLSEDEEEEYRRKTEFLNNSARNLAVLQGADFKFENREGLSAWFERKKENQNKNKKDDKKKKEEEEKRRKEQEKKKKEEEERKKKEEEEKKKKEEEKKEQEKGEEEEEDDENDTVAINLPPEDASVAEAKPVGLAVAGEGGVAASKPIATAVVGPGGLAIARPVGTAIAGVSPDQALVPIYGEAALGGKPQSGGKNKMTEFLNRIISKYHNV